MIELMLMRHAKSDWFSHTTDMGRPLNDRGVRDAIRMGRYLKQENLVPDRVVVSAAQRTQETAELLLNNLSVAEKDIIVDKELYLANRETLCEIIELYAADNQRLLILAHNPGMDDLVSYLANRPVPPSVSGKLMTTCAVARFRIEALNVLKKPGLGQLQKLIRPKEIADTR
jgi:phosphohistidine phosphatase